MKYHLITYGCQMNTADSEEMAQPLKERGFLATTRLQDADIVLMNTCTVREQAEHRADSNIGRLRKWKDLDPHRILIIAGCAASRWGDSIKHKYPFIDLVSPATQIEQFPQAVAQVLKERWNWEAENHETFGNVGADRCPPGNFNPSTLESDPVMSLSGRTALRPYSSPSPFIFGSDDTAYVTIMRGCNYSCSYCIVPQVRGREMYRPMDQIVAEIGDKVRQGFKEVMLLGQTVNSYYWREPIGGVGADRCPPEDKDSTHSDLNLGLLRSSGAQRCAPTVPLDFADLLRAVNAIPGLERLRFMSPHPKHMRDRVIEAMAESSKICRHIHLPLQSGSNRLLSLMKRLYTREEYAAITGKLRSAIPDISITTDVIVGYPGETDDDFEQTLALIQDLHFNGLFAFKYSPRPGTASAQQQDDVSEGIKEERLQRVLTLNERQKSELRMAAM